MKFFNNFFNKRKKNKIKRKIATLQKQAMQHQRNGNLRVLAYIVEQIAELEEQINE